MFVIDNKEYKLDLLKYFIKGGENFIVCSHPTSYVVEMREDNTILPQEIILQQLKEGVNNLLLVDRKVFNLYLSDCNLDMSKVFMVDAVEESKTIESVLEVVNFLNDNNFTKRDTLITVGGGLTQDIAAFTSKIYKRGINWSFFPTTLLSMSDSCIGGKTGINHGNAKNQLALFSAPSKVTINVNFLKTLEEREIISGLGEILKLCITGGTETFDIYTDYVKNGKVENLEDFRPLIRASLFVKRAVVQDDEFEFNRRRSMNYGHSFGHALENASNYEIPHGQAVALGMLVVDKLSTNRGLLSEDERLTIKKEVLDLVGQERISSLNLDDLESLLRKDKKTVGSSVVFVIITRIGNMSFLKLELTKELMAEVKHILTSELKED